MSALHTGGRSCILSSRSTSGRFETDMDILDDAELVRLVVELKEKVKVLTLENEIIERTIMRLEPALIVGVYQALEYYANRIASSTSVSLSRSAISKFGLTDASSRMLSSASRQQVSGSKQLVCPSRLLISPSRASTRKVESKTKVSGGTIVFGPGPKINVLERAELVSKEIEIQITTLNKARNKGAKQHALLKAQLEEIDLKQTEIKKASQMFREEVLIKGWDKIAQRIPAEIWIRFMREWMKMSDSQIGKLRLRTSTLNTQYSKLKGKIKVKAELSESLRPVDFEKLEIENRECLKLIDHKWEQLGELKKMTGDANLNLTIHKKALMEQSNYLNKLLSTTKNRQQLTVQLDKESSRTQLQVDIFAQRLNEIRKVRLKYQVPNVMDYVEVKSRLTSLKHAIKILETRRHIQQIALASIHKKLQTLVEIPSGQETELSSGVRESFDESAKPKNSKKDDA